MRKQFVTGIAAMAIFSLAALPAMAGGLGEPEIEPEVFTESDDVAAGSLGGAPGLILLGVLVGGLVISGDSN